MSQAGPLLISMPVGAGVNQINDQDGDAVTPNLGIVNIIGSGNITTTSDGSNTLTISSTGLATDFIVDNGDHAIPFGGNLYVTGTDNQITTTAPIHGGHQDQVKIGLPNDVTIGGAFNSATVSTSGLITAGNALTVTTGHVRITNGNLGMTNGAILVSDGGIIVHGAQPKGNITADGKFLSQYANGGFVSEATAGHIAFYSEFGDIVTTDGNIVTITGRLTGANLTVTSLNVIGGIVQTDNTGSFTSSVGTNGQILISGGIGPAWANITSPDASVVITNGANSIGLSSGATVATTYHTTAGDAQPAGKILNIVGGSNINTSAVGNTVTANLNNSISLSGTITAAGTITSNFATGGFVSNANGSEHAFYTPDGDYYSDNGYIILTTGNISTTDGNITSTNGTITGKHLVATTDLTLPATALPGAMIKSAAGLVTSSNGTNHQIIATDTTNGTKWRSITSAGSTVAITYPGNNINLEVAALVTKAIWKAGFAANVVNATGDAYTYTFSNMTSRYQSVPCFNTGSPSYFQAPVDGYYQFFMDIKFSAPLMTGLNLLVQATFLINSVIYNIIELYVIATGNDNGDLLCYTTAPMQAGQRMTFQVTGTNNGGTFPLVRNVSIVAQNTSISGFQIS